MKVQIMTDTQFGNGKLLAEVIEGEFNGHNVFIDDVKDITPKMVADRKPDVFILGGAIRMFRGDPKSKRWLKKLNEELRKSNHIIQHGTGFLTHALSTEKVQGWATRFLSKLEKSSMIEKTYSKLLTARVETEKGPIFPAEMKKAKEYTREFINWMSN